MNDHYPAGWNRGVTALMILLGPPLLLPGVCGYLFTRAGMANAVAGLGFLVSPGGVALIGFGIRRLFVPPDAVSISENTKLVWLLVLLFVVVIVGLIVGRISMEMTQVKFRN